MYSDTLPLFRLLLPAYVLSLPDQESGLPRLPLNQDRQSPEKDKKVLIIGATGKIGGIVLMNLESLHQADIYVTTRKNKLINTKQGNDDFTTIDYEDRYNYLDQMDVVISATSSPHYTLTYSKCHPPH